MSVLFNKVTSWSKTKKPEAAYARHHPGSNSNSCLKLAVFGQKSVKKAVKLAIFCTVYSSLPYVTSCALDLEFLSWSFYRLLMLVFL